MTWLEWLSWGFTGSSGGAAQRAKLGLRPRYFKRNEIVEIETADGWVRGTVIRRLREGEDLPFKISWWEPNSTWYLVQFAADGSCAWARKVDLRRPGGYSA
jgi:hypothetical protein